MEEKREGLRATIQTLKGKFSTIATGPGGTVALVLALLIAALVILVYISSTHPKAGGLTLPIWMIGMAILFLVGDLGRWLRRM